MLGKNSYKKRRLDGVSKSELIKELPKKLRIWFTFWDKYNTAISVLALLLLGFNLIYSTVTLICRDYKGFLSSVLWTVQLIGVYLFNNKIGGV